MKNIKRYNRDAQRLHRARRLARYLGPYLSNRRYVAARRRSRDASWAMDRDDSVWSSGSALRVAASLMLDGCDGGK